MKLQFIVDDSDIFKSPLNLNDTRTGELSLNVYNWEVSSDDPTVSTTRPDGWPRGQTGERKKVEREEGVQSWPDPSGPLG